MARRFVLLAALLASAPCEAASLDGTWNTTVECPREPGGGESYVWRFVSTVRGSQLRGQHGTPGQPASMTIEGTLGPDGSGILRATGLAGNPRYNLNNVPGGSPINHQVSVRLSGASGTGERLSGRTCHYTFRRR